MHYARTIFVQQVLLPSGTGIYALVNQFMYIQWDNEILFFQMNYLGSRLINLCFGKVLTLTLVHLS